MKTIEDESTQASDKSFLSKSRQTSTVAGTMRYMAPEWSFNSNECPEERKNRPSTFDQLQKVDIFALGVILSDLLCNPPTFMVQMRIDRDLKASPPKIPAGYDIEGTPEGELLLSLVQKDPALRPTAI